MSQGYGPQDGQQWGQQDPNQQGQWGQQDPSQQGQWGQQPPQQPAQPQWGQQPAEPQWGQASPAPASDAWGQQPAQPSFGSPAEAGYPGTPAPAGYPGAVGGAPQFRTGDGVNWSRVRMLGMSLLIGVALLLLIRVGLSVAQFVMAPSMAAQGEDPGALAIGTSLVTILLAIGNFLVSLAVLVVAIIAAVMGRERARIGGIVVAVMIPVSAVATFIIGIIVGIILGAAGMVDPVTGGISPGGFRITAVVDAIRVLVVIAIMGAGAWFVFDTAKKKLSA